MSRRHLLIAHSTVMAALLVGGAPMAVVANPDATGHADHDATSGVQPAAPAHPADGGLRITNYGHSALLFEGDGHRILINPFKAAGCTSDLGEPALKVDVVLASSRLLDEGAPIAQGTFLASPGSYRFGQLRLEGFRSPHDRLGGRRFGDAVVWTWQQGGLRVAHMGGAATPPDATERILLSGVDVLVIAVGGGAKVFDGAEAAAVVKQLKPRMVIPVQYVRDTVPEQCDQTTIEPFLTALPGVPVVNSHSTIEVSHPLPGQQTLVHMLDIHGMETLNAADSGEP